MVLYKFFDANKFHIDPHFVGWLHRQDNQPPTPEQLEQLYIEHDAFIERAITWDEEQREMIEEYNQKKKELDEKYEKEKFQMLDGGDAMFKVENWVPGAKPQSFKEYDETSIVEVTEIDKLERLYFEEYKLISEKDKSKGKDFNTLAFEELKQAKYYFEYLRTQEKLFKYEQQLQLDKVSTQTTQTSTTELNQDNAAVVSQESVVDQLIEQEVMPEKLTQKQINEIKRNNKSVQKLEAMKKLKREELESNRYSEFRDEFKDIFEVLVDRKQDKDYTEIKM